MPGILKDKTIRLAVLVLVLVLVFSLVTQLSGVTLGQAA